MRTEEEIRKLAGDLDAHFWSDMSRGSAFNGMETLLEEVLGDRKALLERLQNLRKFFEDELEWNSQALLASVDYLERSRVLHINNRIKYCQKVLGMIGGDQK